MLLPVLEDIDQKQLLIKSSFEQDLCEWLRFGADYFKTSFPAANVQSIHQGALKTWNTNSVLKYKENRIKNWCLEVLANAVKVSKGEEIEDPPGIISMPEKIKIRLLDAVLQILSYGRELNDLDYYFLNDINISLGLDKSLVSKAIEQTTYENRKNLFKRLKSHLNWEQREIFSLIMVKAIRADNKVHPAEIKYFEIISILLDYDQISIENLETKSESLDKRLPLMLSKEIAEFLFKYLVEIVMCDKDYDPEESAFIKEIASSFGFDQAQQDSILQPVAATLMVKTDLFQ